MGREQRGPGTCPQQCLDSKGFRCSAGWMVTLEMGNFILADLFQVVSYLGTRDLLSGEEDKNL